MSYSKQQEVTIIGAGLVGSLCACFLANRNYIVNVYEKREDIRTINADSGKSINLALSYRARKALKTIGLEDAILKCAVPMKGRTIHDPLGKTKFLPYDIVTNQCLYSVNRNHLNQVLLSAVENKCNVKMFFQHELLKTDLNEGSIHVRNLKSLEVVASKSPDLVIGADGAHSSLRADIQRQNTLFSFSQKYIDSGYMELTINSDNGASLHRNSLHIWPRSSFMMIALPNLDFSWTVTLFMPFEKFEKLRQSPANILEFFKITFPDSVELLGQHQILNELTYKKPRSLVSISCDPFHFGDKILLLGDAAHAMVPFYGQGLNAGFEDCSLLNEILDANEDKVAKSISEFTRIRREDAHAICNLAMYNYEEMRDLVTRKSYRLRKFLDEILYLIVPKFWIPLYISVTFTDMGYKQCMDNRKWQNQIILKTFLFIAIGITLMWAFN